MAKDQRFEKVYSQGMLETTDKKTGVNYIFHTSGNAAGFTPLLDSEGKPVVSSVWDK